MHERSIYHNRQDRAIVSVLEATRIILQLTANGWPTCRTPGVQIARCMHTCNHLLASTPCGTREISGCASTSKRCGLYAVLGKHNLNRVALGNGLNGSASRNFSITSDLSGVPAHVTGSIDDLLSARSLANIRSS